MMTRRLARLGLGGAVAALWVGLAWADPAMDLALGNSPPATPVTSAAVPRVDTGFFDDILAAWRRDVAEATATQPHWASPITTTTPLLKERVRFDFDVENSGNGTTTDVIDGGKGVDFIVSPTNEIQLAAPPYYVRSGVAGVGVKNKGAIAPLAGWNDWTFLRVEQRLAASPETAGNYVVTTWLQVQAPTGIARLTSTAWQLVPTIAFGKGFGDFEVQSTVGASIPLSDATKLGHPITTNIAFQYHIRPIFWPEFEVNWTYYPDGSRAGLSQVLLTPGVVLSSFKLGDGLGLTLATGYQVAVAPSYRKKPLTPSYDNAWVVSTRLNF